LEPDGFGLSSLLLEQEAKVIVSASSKSFVVVFIAFYFLVDEAKEHQTGILKQVKVDEREVLTAEPVY